MKTIEDRLLSKFAEMQEDDFTQDIIKPLLKKLGYYKVDYNGGPREMGRDLICWRHDEIDDIEVMVAQVKMSKPKARSSGNDSLPTIITQLSQAISNEIENENGQKYKPSTCYFITPAMVDNRELSVHFMPLAQNSNIKIIDGIKLVLLMKKHMPEKVNEILGNLNDIQTLLSESLINDELQNALNMHDKKDIISYLDIDISSVAYGIKLEASCCNLFTDNALCTVHSSKWDTFKDSYKNLCANFRVSHELFNIGDIEKNYILFSSIENIQNNKLLSSKYKKMEDLIKSVSSSLDAYAYNLDVKEEVDSLNDELDIVEKMSASLVRIREYFLAIKEAHYKFLDDSPKTLHKLIKKIISLNEQLYIKLKNSFAFHEAYNNINNSTKQIVIILNELIELKKITIEKNDYTFIIEVGNVESSFNNSIDIILGKMHEDIDNYIACLEKIKNFKTVCNIFFHCVNNIDIKYDKVLLHNISSISVMSILKSGLNIIIEGDAGAGKTTTLRQFAQEDTDSKRLYLPLSKILKYMPEEHDLNSRLETFIGSIYMYIVEKGVKSDLESLKKLLFEENIVLLFDGLDEIVSKIPWTFEILCELSKKSKAAITISSRPNHINNEQNDFIAVKLMPFDKERTKKFISGWFKGEHGAIELIKHIEEYNLWSLVGNPLTATIFCSLKAQNVPLPITEIELYEERFKLLLGHYDIHKKINRNNIHKAQLEKFSRKIAFYFHTQKIKSSTLCEIEKFLINEFHNIGDDDISNTLKELVAPSNILVEDLDDTSKFGFGHLRYQEFLVAKEIQQNRGIFLDTVLRDDWLGGALYLFSKLTDDIKPIFDDLISRYASLLAFQKNLNLMINARNKIEGEDLLKLVSDYSKLEKIDYVAEDNDLYEDDLFN